MRQDKIYALYYEWADERQYFYVGHTYDPKRRIADHRRNVKDPKHKEDVYQFIRERCQPCGIDTWDMEILWTQANCDPEDCEDFWVVLMIRAGHKLQNMKRGDLHRIALEMLAKQQGDFTDVDEFVEFKKRVEREQREAYERSERLRREVLGEVPGDPELMAMIQANAERFRKENAARRLREQKREARAIARAREKEAWLRSMRARDNGE
jgi:hypothetical protein